MALPKMYETVRRIGQATFINNNQSYHSNNNDKSSLPMKNFEPHDEHTDQRWANFSRCGPHWILKYEGLDKNWILVL